MSKKHEETPLSNNEPQHEFLIQRIYVKDLSYETPGAPDIFTSEWVPQVDIDLNTESKKLTADSYEVTLKITVTAKLKDKTAFLVEVKQAGIFTLKGFTEEQIGPMLGSFCPNILFPYTRELISETICRGSFPPLYLSPINFDAYYQEQLNQGKK
jgi:protein-export chaperone SecB